MIVFLAAVAYLIGSIPTGLLVARWVMGVDIRSYGSGNIGAANVLRLLGVSWAVFVFLLDAAKGAVPVLAARHFGLEPWSVVIVGLLAVAGHNWSVFMGFQGGKGVASSLGILFVLGAKATLVAGVVWIGAVALFGYASLGSMLALAAAGPLFWWFGQPSEFAWLGGCLFVLTVWQHRANIKRLIQGKELRFSQRISAPGKSS